MNYYNEIDPNCCAWLRELIADRLIPDGEIDQRSICDVQPEDLAGFVQCHFFAGIGGWSYALRLAGWPDDRPVWTGSCPCQPLSCAGKRKGHADERHLWPSFYRLIAECKPATVFGEQVAGVDGREWLAGVRADLEGTGYAVGASDLCAAGAGAPHIRQRLYWVANTDRTQTYTAEQGQCLSGEGLRLGRLADTEHGGLGSERDATTGRREPVSSGRLGDTNCERGQASRLTGTPGEKIFSYEGQTIGTGSSLLSNFWSSSIWHPCRDGKSRRIPRPQPGLFGVSHGLPEGMDLGWLESGFPLSKKVKGRVQLLKGYGNAIVPELAAAFIRAAM